MLYIYCQHYHAGTYSALSAHHLDYTTAAYTIEHNDHMINTLMQILGSHTHHLIMFIVHHAWECEITYGRGALHAAAFLKY